MGIRSVVREQMKYIRKEDRDILAGFIRDHYGMFLDYVATLRARERGESRFSERWYELREECREETESLLSRIESE